MTIFHVLRYPPDDVVHKYLIMFLEWDEIVPADLAKKIKDHLYEERRVENNSSIIQTLTKIRFRPAEYKEHITKVLLEYDGPLE